jgi:organic radical activating enzyme
MAIRSQVLRLSYMKKHLRDLLPYITVRKAANVVLNLLEKELKVGSPRSFPPYVKIESTPACQLSCTGCAHRDPEFKRRFNATTHLTLADFKRIIDPIASTTLGVSLSFRGEPMLNRDLPKMIAYAHQRGIATSYPSNLSMPMTSQIAEEYVRSGLDTLYVSLDGASKQTYDLYRVGGVFSRVLANTRLLADTKLRLQSKRPHLVWKMVVFDHNRHEIPVQKSNYRELGFDDFELVPDNQSKEAKDEMDHNNRHMIESKSGCFWLWNTMVVNSTGGVVPCCTDEDFGLGNALKMDVREIWSGAAYRSLRSAFSSNGYGKEMHPVCRECIGLSAAKSSLVPLTTSAG